MCTICAPFNCRHSDYTIRAAKNVLQTVQWQKSIDHHLGRWWTLYILQWIGYKYKHNVSAELVHKIVYQRVICIKQIETQIIAYALNIIVHTYITALLHTGAAAILVNQESQNGQMAIGSCIPQCTLPTLHTYHPGQQKA